MKTRRFTIAFLFLFASLISSSAAFAQGPDQVADLLARINRERTSRGKLPYALNPSLSQAAQIQANYMSATGKLSHTGPDGSTVFDRVGKAGYGAYSWGRRVGENWAWYRDTETAMQKWMASKPHRDNILHDVYREIGIGVAKGPGSGFIYVTDFAAQPNMLPSFVNDGAAITGSQNVTLALSDENVFDSSPSNIQHVKQVQLSNQADFAGAGWQPFANHIPWTLTAGAGLKTIYIKYQDSRGKTTTATDTITLVSGASNAQPPATTAPTVKSATPTRTRTATKGPTATATKTSKPSATSTRISTVTRTPRPTLTPTGVLAPQARFGPQVASKSPSATPTTPDPDASQDSPTPKPEVVPSEFPADTPAPIVGPQPVATIETATEATTETSADEQPSTTPVQVAFVPTPLPETAALSSEPDLSPAASNGPAPGSGSPDENPLEPFALGLFAVGLVMGVLASGKYLFRNRS